MSRDYEPWHSTYRREHRDKWLSNPFCELTGRLDHRGGLITVTITIGIYKSI